eukprot:CAMPEP_0198144736 /NCGR_PEP_ID=MMETSP1443-20131203/18214_1 /TAXON_ID=186043 /ORGANISM="Entomoneis sp., Strain CCMP2396" /LENGTH=144 /DNA_ID=CAMNT_0043808191 /DNA_START=139 /DNA_END=573 /DNA_ORIENTATION=-
MLSSFSFLSSSSIGAARRCSLPSRHVAAAVFSSRGFATSTVKEIKEADYAANFLKDNDKSIFYFTAVWCPPCKAIKPVYEELSTKYSDVAFGKLDVDVNQDSATEYEISAVPTFIFFHQGSPVNRFSGADPTELETLIKDLQSR